MDTTEQQSPSPIYQYTATVWVARTYKIVAETDEALEEAVEAAMADDGLDPDTYEMIRLSSTRTPITWQ